MMTLLADKFARLIEKEENALLFRFLDAAIWRVSDLVRVDKLRLSHVERLTLINKLVGDQIEEYRVYSDEQILQIARNLQVPNG
jgi:hypothetical protein